MENRIKYPIGIQDFEKLREEGYVYVDKTRLLYEMVKNGTVYFLSRPRRFGKSLLITTLEAYFSGKKELFADLEIAELEKEWIQHPVFHLDLNAAKYDSVEDLKAMLNYSVSKWEDIYGRSESETSISLRFGGVIERAFKKTGQRVVVLVDEYDKPLLNTITNKKLNDEYKNELKAFFGVLKSFDKFLKFVFLTGVTKFGQVSVFSDLNQLKDISFNPIFATLCGITKNELEPCFATDIQKLADKNHQTYQQALAALKRLYDGYHFCENSEGVYNPFSTLSVLDSGKYSDYWFQTGTPTFLMELLKETDYDLTQLEHEQLFTEDFSDYRADAVIPIPVIYQSGYLTVKDYDPVMRAYTLGFPNEEVKFGFLNSLLPHFTGIQRKEMVFHVNHFAKSLEEGDVDGFMQRMKALFASVPYTLNNKTEKHYQTLFFFALQLLGQRICVEERSARGRSDAVIKVPNIIYVFEFKLDGSVDEALQQIEDKGYMIPYSVPDGSRLIKVGVNFSTETRNIEEWKMVNVETWRATSQYSK